MMITWILNYIESADCAVDQDFQNKNTLSVFRRVHASLFNIRELKLYNAASSKTRSDFQFKNEC